MRGRVLMQKKEQDAVRKVEAEEAAKLEQSRL